MTDAWDMWKDEEEPVPTSFNPYKLATYFQRSHSEAAWSSGFVQNNHAALMGAFSKWKKAGATVEEVTDMIDAYMSRPELRGKNPGWVDFLAKREQIAASLPSTGENTQLSEWDRIELEYL